jgi:hypothetical protein
MVMRYLLSALLLLSCSLVSLNVRCEDLKPEETLKAIRNTDLKLSKESGEEVKTESELLSFDQGKDDVIWVRTYAGDEKITQVYSIVKDRMNVKDGQVVIPMIWQSMANPAERNYNPDKHDVGLRCSKENGKWVVLLYCIDTKGKEIDLKFEEK